MQRSKARRNTAIALFSSVPAVAGLLFFISSSERSEYIPLPAPLPTQEERKAPARVVPNVVKAVYVTMHTAAQGEKMSRLIELVNKTELNAMVIDVKGSQGELAFGMLDVGELVQRLHQEGIYAIARVVVFQDDSAVQRVPQAVIQRKGGGVWRDNRGFAWLDPAGEEGWEYIFDVSRRALDAGFDEINYDYIRFPSDGRIDLAVYPAWKEETPRHEVIARFARTAREALKAHAPDMQLSIDIFGYSFLQSDDLGIGQKLEDLVEPFDGVYPMVYPSHYKSGNFRFANPAEHPYEVVSETLGAGLERFGDKAAVYAKKIRPWLQAFDLGAVYSPEKMKAQIQATHDALGDNSTGWLLWDPGNEYERAETYLSK